MNFIADIFNTLFGRYKNVADFRVQSQANAELKESRVKCLDEFKFEFYKSGRVMCIAVKMSDELPPLIYKIFYDYGCHKMVSLFSHDTIVDYSSGLVPGAHLESELRAMAKKDIAVMRTAYKNRVSTMPRNINHYWHFIEIKIISSDAIQTENVVKEIQFEIIPLPNTYLYGKFQPDWLQMKIITLHSRYSKKDSMQYFAFHANGKELNYIWTETRYSSVSDIINLFKYEIIAQLIYAEYEEYAGAGGLGALRDRKIEKLIGGGGTITLRNSNE